MARREARRTKGRSALVVAMIMIPVAGLVFLAIGNTMFTLSPRETADRKMGAAQAFVEWQYDGPVQQLPDFLQPFPNDGTTSPTSDNVDEDRLRAWFPAGTKLASIGQGTLEMRTATGIGSVAALQLDYADPLARGMFTQLSGQAPKNADEIAVTSAAAQRLGASVDSTVRLADGSRSFRVTAIVENPGDLGASTMLLPSSAPRLTENRQALSWLVGSPSPITWAQVKELNTHGVIALSRHVLDNPPPPAEQYQLGIRYSGGTEGIPPGTLTLIGGLGLLQVVLLAGPAFAVSARRRRRELALIAASGGTPAQVRRIVLADGVVLGAFAAIAGVALGIAAMAVLHPVLEKQANYRAAPFGVDPLAMLIIGGLAVLTGVAAALVPAWISSRQDVVTALAGRRGITRTRRRWPIIGLGLMVIGAGVVTAGALQEDTSGSGEDLTFVLLGMIIFEFGIVLCTPTVVGLVSRLGRWLPVALRIALRDSSRNRTAAASAISAVMTAVVGSIAIGVVFLSVSARDASENAGRPGDVMLYRVGSEGGPDQSQQVPADVVATARAYLPVKATHEINFPSCGETLCFVYPRVAPEMDCPYRPDRLRREPTADEQRAARADERCAGLRSIHRYFNTIGSDHGLTVIIDASSPDAVVDVPAEDVDSVKAALNSGKVVVEHSRYLENGSVTLAINEPGRPSADEKTVSLPGFVLPHGAKAPIAMMTEQTAQRLGIGVQPFGVVVSTTRMPTVDEADQAQAAVGTEYEVIVDRGVETNNQALIIIAIVAGVISLATAAFATGLSAADGRADLATLAAVGASPGVRKVLSLSQSGVIAGLGSVLGAAAGLGASVAVLTALNARYADTWPAPTPFPIMVPWLNLGIALLVVPLVAMLGAGLITRSRLPIERRL
jgi:putative ABC transport system permease protein